MSATEIVALPLKELEPTKFMFSEKKTKSWDFMDQKTKTKRNGSKTITHLYYGTPGSKLCFVLNNVKSYQGIQTPESFKKGYIQFTLSKEQSQELKTYLENPVFSLCYQHKNTLIKGGNKIQAPAEMRIIYSGIIKDGKEKSEGSGEYWPDQISLDVPMKKKGQQVTVDDNLCTIEDADNTPYSWSALDGKNIAEVVVQVEEVSFGTAAGDKIRMKGVVKLISVDDKAAPKITTKRRMEQKKRSHAEMSGGGAAAPNVADQAAPNNAEAGPGVASPALETKEPASKKPKAQ
jgi:hypothetical protein